MLIPAADRFVAGGAAIAGIYKISPLVVGLVIIGFGTSAPEMLVSAIAAWDGKPELAIGNAIGSNISNIALVLGAAALVAPLTVQSSVLRRELPIPLIAMLIALVLLLDGVLSRQEGILLLAGFVLLIYGTVQLALRQKSRAGADPMESGYADAIPVGITTGKAIMLTLTGLAWLLVSARMLEWSAVQVAHAWGMSDLVIGLTVVSVGTGLPELATAISAARKGEHEMVIGNVVGSNTFNILAVMGIAGTIHPGGFGPEVLSRDFPVMVGLTLALFVMAYGFRGSDGCINRLEGAILLAAFVGYMGWLLHIEGLI